MKNSSRLILETAGGGVLRMLGCLEEHRFTRQRILAVHEME
jgi:hypothetical protein